MSLPLSPPIAPMLSKAAERIPTGDGWHYEPKWDGFRCVVFRDGDDVVLTSRNERPFNRYFPELVDPLRAVLPERCVVDGEIVLPDRNGNGLDFDGLLQRIHPAERRVRRLAAETPASFVAFDMLVDGDKLLLDDPLAFRLAHLRVALTDAEPPIYLTPSSTDPAVAEQWFHRFEGAGLDGVVAKRLTDVYTPDKRTLVKVKHSRDADCVVAGYRVHKDGKGVGSLLLGLYDDEGRLHHVGVTAAFTAKFRAELLTVLEPLTHDALAGHPWADWADPSAHAEARLPGAQSRWNAKKDLSWVPLRVEWVAEISFGQLQNGRFRHGVQFHRWRPDRMPQSCTYDQLDVADPVSFDELMANA
ncbi:MAG TPA: ATP-dependent DNA ligase [Ilumatobacteraceae bacterium]|nr:ATP-dependent DNA ligase [Ilumatobacteraceae bacterium]